MEDMNLWEQLRHRIKTLHCKRIDTDYKKFQKQCSKIAGEKVEFSRYAKGVKTGLRNKWRNE